MVASQIAPLSETPLTTWKKEIERARAVRKEVSEDYDWEGNLDRYAAKSTKETEGKVNIGADFADVERKKTALFYAKPDVSLVPDQPDQPLVQPQPPQPGAPPPPPPPTLGQLALVHQDLLNEVLGPSQIDIKPVVHKAILNVLLTAGVGPVQVGYRATTVDVPLPVPDPVTGLPALDATGQPVMQVTPVPVHEEYFASNLSPKALLLPGDFRDTDIRNAAWIGYEFTRSKSQLRADYKLPPDFEFPNAGTEKPFFRKDDQPGQGAGEPDEQVSGVYIEYRSALYGLSSHPQAVHCLVLLDGSDVPLKHGPSPNQTIAKDGRLTPDSLTGFSIMPLWIRDLPDSAWVPSDCTITAPLTRELNKFRSQAVEQRDTAKQIILIDAEKVTAEAKAKIENGKINTFVPVRPGALDGGKDSIAVQIATASLGRESYLGQDYIQADRDKILGISANQQGSQNSTKRSATEVTTAQRNSDARFNHEQQRVMEWYLGLVRAIDALVLRHCDARMAAQFVGPQKGQFWAQFKGALAGGYRYEMHMDSGKYLDIEASRRQWIQMYQMTRQDPLLNPRPVLEKLLQTFGIDPQSAIVQPPKAQPAPPPAAFSFKGEDLNPQNPAFELIVKMAQQGGWDITPDDITRAKEHAQLVALVAPATGVDGEPGQPAANEKHGGPATQQMPLSKRMSEETGGVSGPKETVQ